jgi:hypothetical protein
MAKRTRGSHRPGQRHADRHARGRSEQRPGQRPSHGLSAEEEARAAELESQIVAREREADLSRGRLPDRARGGYAERPGRAGGQGLLAVRAAEEYGYVVRDIGRIVRIGGSMVAVLLILWILVRVMNVITI